MEKSGIFSDKLIKKLEDMPAENRIWCHTVSVGEFNAAKPLIKALIAKDLNVIISTTTATGNALARKTYPDLPVFYFPFDLPCIINNSLNLLKPSIVVILETEIWPNLLFNASKLDIPVLMANGRLSEKSFKGYKRFKFFFRWVLNHYRFLIMQSDSDAGRMRTLGVEHEKIRVAGNIKFDLPAIEHNALQDNLKALFKFSDESKIIVFASTHPGEEEIFIEIFKSLASDFPYLKTVIAPRHPERAKEVCTVLANKDVNFVLRSKLASEHPNTGNTPVILLDTIGELQDVFAISHIACMGGSFISRGGHNPLEAVNAKIPVIFGPYMENFRDIALQVIKTQAGYQVKNTIEAEKVIRELIAKPEQQTQIVIKGQQLLAQNRGATSQILDYIVLCLEKNQNKKADR